MSRGQIIKEGIETVVDNIGNFIKSAKTPLAKNRRIAQIAKDRGYRRLGSGNDTFYPVDLLVLDKTRRGGRWKLKDPNFQKYNNLEVNLDKDGIPVSHKITQKTLMDKKGRIPRRDDQGKIISYAKPENIDTPGIGNYKRSEEDRQNLINLRKQVAENTVQQNTIYNNAINRFFELNPQLDNISSVNFDVIKQIRDFLPVAEMGLSKGKKPTMSRLSNLLEKMGRYKKVGKAIDDSVKQKVKNYLLQDDKWKTLSSRQVIEDLNLKGDISESTLISLRREGFDTGKSLAPIPKERTSLAGAKGRFNTMLTEKYGGDKNDPVRNRLGQAFADYLADAYGVGRKQGYTQNQIDEGFKFVEDTELAINTPEGQAYQEMFETLRIYNDNKIAEINADRVAQGLKPLSYQDPRLDDVILTMGHARLNPETGKMGAFDLSKVEPETRGKNKLALKLGRQLQVAIREDNLPAVDRIVSEMIRKGIRHEVTLPSRKFKGVGEAEGLVDTIDDTFVIGGETPEPFPVEPLAEGGMAGENVLEEPMIDEETGILDYLSDKKKQFEDLTGITKADEALQNFVEEDLGGNPFRAVPVGISKILQVPGQIKDKFIETRSNVNEDLDQLAFAEEEKGNIDEANRIRSLKSGQGLLGEFDNPITITTGFFNMMTEPLQDGYQNMFTDDDYFYNPITGEKFMADTGFKKAMAAGSTLGLTALEIMLAFNPLKISAIGKLPPSKMTTVLQTGADFLANAVPFIAAYETKEPNIRDLFGISEEVRNETAKIVEDQEQLQEAERDANVGVEAYNMKADGGLMGDELPMEFLENRDYAQTRLSRGGDPGQFTNPTSLALEEDFDARDILNEPGYESIEELDDLFDITKKENRFTARDDLSFDVASRGEGLKYILQNVPKWVRDGKERIKMGVDNLLPGTREQPPGLPAVIDDAGDGLTPLTKAEPGQIFYQQMEAELLQGPKVFKDKQAFFDYMQARNIGKVEVLDSEIERVIDSLTQKNMPITRETLIGVLRESPVRFVQSKGYGFLSNTLDGQQRGLKYSGYKEAGEIDGTSRERVLFVDPKDLRGDPGSVPGSVSQHNWEEPYTIAWSRLSDRDLGGAYGGKTVTFADEIQSDIFQASQKMAGKLSAKVKYMAENNVPLDKIDNDIQKELLAYFGDRKHVFRESLPSAAALKQEYDQLMSLQAQLRELANTPVPDMTDAMIEAAKKVQFQQADILDNLTQKLNLDLNRYLFPNLPFKLRGQWADASIKRDIYEAAYRKFVLKDPNATDYYAVTPANLVTKRYSHEGTTATPAAERAADKERRIQSWVSGGMEGDIASSRYPGVGMYEFYGGPGADVITESGKHYTSEIEKILKRIARENNVPLEVLPVRTGDRGAEVFNVVDRETGQILGTGNTGRQADAIANDIIENSDRKVIVQRAEGFDTTDSFGIELTPSMAEAFKAYMAKGGYVNEEILLPYGD